MPASILHTNVKLLPPLPPPLSPLPSPLSPLPLPSALSLPSLLPSLLTFYQDEMAVDTFLSAQQTESFACSLVQVCLNPSFLSRLFPSPHHFLPHYASLSPSSHLPLPLTHKHRTCEQAKETRKEYSFVWNDNQIQVYK